MDDCPNPLYTRLDRVRNRRSAESGDELVIFELVNTSAPNGLRPGERGFTTVAMTEGTPAPLVRELEARSTYDLRSQGREVATPEAFHGFSHCCLAGHKWLILTRVVPCGLDYTNRPNRLAHHIALDFDDVPTGSDPASILANGEAFYNSWNYSPRLLERRELPRAASGDPSLAWTEATGDPDWAADIARQLATRGPGGSMLLLHSAASDPLALARGILAEVNAEDQWRIAFSTDARQHALSRGSRLRFAPEGTVDDNQPRGAIVVALGSLKGQPAPRPAPRTPEDPPLPAPERMPRRQVTPAEPPVPLSSPAVTSMNGSKVPAVAVVTDEHDHHSFSPLMIGVGIASVTLVVMLGGLVFSHRNTDDSQVAQSAATVDEAEGGSAEQIESPNGRTNAAVQTSKPIGPEKPAPTPDVASKPGDSTRYNPSAEDNAGRTPDLASRHRGEESLGSPKRHRGRHAPPPSPFKVEQNGDEKQRPSPSGKDGQTGDREQPPHIDDDTDPELSLEESALRRIEQSGAEPPEAHEQRESTDDHSDEGSDADPERNSPAPAIPASSHLLGEIELNEDASEEWSADLPYIG